MRGLKKVFPAAMTGDLTRDMPAPADALRYLLYLPDAFEQDAERLWPLVLALHGSGERGSELELVAAEGLPRLAHEGRDFPFVLVAPQCSEHSQWGPETTTLNHLLDEVSETFRIDPARIYVTGFSMGGFGTWSLAIRYPEKFAAIAPICGGLWNQHPTPIRNLPIWIFHGEEDLTVPIDATEQIVSDLEACGSPVRFTRYPGVGHDAWTRTYDDPAFYDWLLSHRRTNESSETGGS